jgi:hypothetical protein
MSSFEKNYNIINIKDMGRDTNTAVIIPRDQQALGRGKRNSSAKNLLGKTKLNLFIENEFYSYKCSVNTTFFFESANIIKRHPRKTQDMDAMKLQMVPHIDGIPYRR